MRAPDPVITLSPVLDADSSSAHLISLRIPAPIGHQAQHPAPIGRGMAPQVARAQLPVAAARIVSPASISSALASERNIYCSAPGPRVCVCPAPIFGGFMWEYCGLLHHPRAARDREELCIIKCHKI